MVETQDVGRAEVGALLGYGGSAGAGAGGDGGGDRRMQQTPPARSPLFPHQGAVNTF